MVYTHDTQGPPFQCDSCTVTQYDSLVQQCWLNQQWPLVKGSPMTHRNLPPFACAQLHSTLSDCLVQQCW